MVKLNSPQTFATNFVDKYLQNGFGIMNKGELEVLIFHLFRVDKSFNCKSIFEISRELHISETKVRKLIYDADLRYGQTDDKFIKNEFFHCLTLAKFHSDNNMILFPIDNKVVRSAIDDKLKSLGYFSDTSFNRDIFSIHIEALVALVDSYYDETVKKTVLNKCEKIIRKSKNDKLTFRQLIRELILGACDGVGKISLQYIFTVLSDNQNNVSELISVITKLFN